MHVMQGAWVQGYDACTGVNVSLEPSPFTWPVPLSPWNGHGDNGTGLFLLYTDPLFTT